MGGLDKTEAIEGCVTVSEDLLSLKGLLSDVYMTARFVEGEFMVPVNDHPMAVYE